MASENREKYAEYPLTGIQEPHPHDVLCGRGGGTNGHVGNLHWRMLVAANKELYVNLPKRQKALLSKSVVNAVRSQSPPGRFLAKEKNNLYCDIGDQKATEKTSQALREGAPDLRSKMKETTSPSAPDPVVSSSLMSTTINAAAVSEQSNRTEADDSRDRFHEPNTEPFHHPAVVQPLSTLVQTADKSDLPPPTILDESPGFSFGSVLLSEEEQRRLEKEGSQRVVNFDPGVVQKQTDRVFSGTGTPEFVAPVDGGLEPAGLSTGTAMSLGTINTAMLDSVPEMVGTGLDAGMSIGTILSAATAPKPTPTLDSNTGTSFGSTMSYKPTPEAVDGGLEAIGTSLGSLSISREKYPEHDINESVYTVEEPTAPSDIAPPLLQQRQTKASLLADSDSDSEDGSEAVSAAVSMSNEWGRMQAAFASHQSQTGSSARSQSGGSVTQMPPPANLVPHHVDGRVSHAPSMLNVPTTNDIQWDVSGMTEAGLTRESSKEPPVRLQEVLNSTAGDWESYEASLLQGGQSYNLPPPENGSSNK